MSKSYQARLPTSELKKQDLMKLCDHLAVHEEFHGWYRALPISTRNIDQLPEPATDDSGDDDGES